MKWILSVLVILTMFSFEGIAQRKLPNITFQAHSTEFANANRKYNDRQEFVDTLKDEHIIVALAKILHDNPELQIEIGGHTAMNEESSLGEDRANRVYTMLLEDEIEEERLKTENFGNTQPIISTQTIFSLPNAIEKEAANQKNRRVEIKVVELVEE